MNEQQQYEKFIEGLSNYINKTANKTSLFIHLHKKIHEKFDDVELAPILFLSIRESLQVDLVISLAKLYEHSSTKNLNKFLNFVESNLHKFRWKGENISQQKLNEHKQLIKSQESAISHIMAQRNKYFAHHDKEYFMSVEKLNDDYPVRVDDVVSLIEVAQKIINEHSWALNSGITSSLCPMYVLSLEQIFEKLRELNRMKIQEINPIANLRKHGIDFVDVPAVFERDIVTVEDDRYNYGEQRFITLGLLQGRVVAIVHTERDDRTRIISARKATRYEQRTYFEQISN